MARGQELHLIEDGIDKGRFSRASATNNENIRAAGDCLTEDSDVLTIRAAVSNVLLQ